jgi:hypothetical protein
MYSRPALAKYWAFGGEFEMPRVSAIMRMDRPIGDGRSLQADFMEPGCICSKPMTRVQSIEPFLMRVRARWRPVEPVAQALLVL